VDDQDQVFQGSTESREEARADVAEHVVVIADDQAGLRGRIHRDPMRAHATGAARADELLDVQRALEDRSDHRGIVSGEEAASPRLHAEIAEFLERPAVGRRGLLQAHRGLRDQTDRSDPYDALLAPPDRLDGDPMVALAWRRATDELVGGES